MEPGSETAVVQRFESSLMSASRGIRRIYDLWLGELGLNLTESLLLSHVAAHGPTIQAKLAEELGLGRPATGDVIDSLVARGLVIRQPDARDRRVWLVVTTDAGQAQAARVAALDAELGRSLRRGLSKQERAQLAAMLGAVQGNLDQMLANWSSRHSR